MKTIIRAIQDEIYTVVAPPADRMNTSGIQII